jgi:N-acetylglucosamine malate deacetylase 2
MKLNASCNAHTWQRFADGLKAAGYVDTYMPKMLVLAAHPDDETIGASVAVGSRAECWVLFLTDGAPRNQSLRSAHSSMQREAYAELRYVEAQHALSCAGMPPDRITCLNCIDQEAIYNVPSLVDDLAAWLQNFRPDAIITHPYEGGHPDHDAAALIASLALDLLAEQSDAIPSLIEMSSYHAVNQQLRTGEFLGGSGTQLSIALTAEQRRRKQRMLACYASQAAVLQSFGTDREVFRPAMAYDFNAAPHAGKLWYECLGWEITGEKWRTLAHAALNEMNQHVCR